MPILKTSRGALESISLAMSIRPDDSPRRLLEHLEAEVVGQTDLLLGLIVALLADGHVLLEGVPGLAKTRAVRVLAQALDLRFQRVPFTPDLLPADLTGTQIYRPSTGEFETRVGPIFTNLLLADEINRAPAKVQSALLEAMQERQVTLGEQTRPLPEPFLVLATQNPIEHEGTYPLPEAQLDRFLLKLIVKYPSRTAERALLDLPSVVDEDRPPPTPPAWNAADLKTLRAHARAVHVAPPIKDYILDVARATRSPAEYGLDLAPLIELGVSPRATISLLRAARAWALIQQRDYVTPADVKRLAPDVFRHRLIPSFEAEAEGIDADSLLQRILDHVPIP